MKKVVLGIGNSLKGDDGIGVYVAARIQSILVDINDSDEEIIPLNCGTAPENCTSVMRRHRPDSIILVDATDMGLPPGSFRIIPQERIGGVQFSTHDFPLSLFLSYVKEFCPQVLVIGIQPAIMELGAPLSDGVKKSGDIVAGLISQNKTKEIALLDY
jgi:hydrogenase 3 maturation protease